MPTVYDYDLHDLAQSTFQSIQQRALFEQSLRQSMGDAAPNPSDPSAPADPSAPTTSSAALLAPPVTSPGQRKGRHPGGHGGGLMKKLMIGAAVLGAVGAAGGAVYFMTRPHEKS